MLPVTFAVLGALGVLAAGSSRLRAAGDEAPLSVDPQPGSYDLCEDHADRLVAPLGWTLTDIRIEDAAAPSELAS
jgi:hypothetical protein